MNGPLGIILNKDIRAFDRGLNHCSVVQGVLEKGEESGTRGASSGAF